GTADRNRSHWSTSKTPSYTKSVSWQHHPIKDLQSKAPDKNIVIFTHNHCLTYIAKDKRDATFKPDYLDGLVMHVEKGKVYLDGEFVNH
ncbi:hypothetical protein SND27_20940, partial [Escherichia coli]|nr:hypothetical protein [Escherichia coli]MEA0338447.1 hypothetical protein [Escherichia coli]